MKFKRRWARWLCGAVLVASAGAASAAVDMFLKVDDVKGEAIDDDHGGEIALRSWSIGATSPAIVQPDGSRRAGKISLSNLLIVKSLDTASPQLMSRCASGEHFGRATLTLRNNAGSAVEFAHLVLEDVNVESVSMNLSAGDGEASEAVDFGYKRIGIEYFTILPTGKPGERSAFVWDVPAGTIGTVLFPNSDPNADADGDGLPDAWEAQFGVTDPAADNDGDGATNLEEFIAGTSPVDRNQVFRSRLTYVAGAPTATLSWASTPGKRYLVLVADEIGGDYRLGAEANASNEATTSVTLPATAIRQFFRVLVAP